tara:strand:+ start:329 stop:979 length:651 start_codon:yes stop_codon:yes gene_type:complete
LPPDPNLIFRESDHKYYDKISKRIFPLSITEVINSRRNSFVNKNMEDGAKRGTHIHACLERFLNTGHAGTQHPYEEWISKLVEYRYWSKVTPIAVELELCDRKHMIAGKLDALVVHKETNKIILVDLKTRKAKKDEKTGKVTFSKESATKLHKQFGGYLDLLYQNYRHLWVDECMVIYSHQYGVDTDTFTDLEEYRALYQTARSIYFHQQNKIYGF